MFDNGKKTRRQSRWDKVHLRTVSTHLREEENELFRIACSLERTTRYAVVQALTRNWLEAWWAAAEDGTREEALRQRQKCSSRQPGRPAPSHCGTGRKGRDERT